MDCPYLPRSTAMAQEEFVHWLYAALAEDVTLEPSYTVTCSSGESGSGEFCLVSGLI